MTGITFVKAERSKAKLRMAITGASGSGKTYTSLLIARGLVGDSGKIAVADTENRSAALYSHLTDFDTCIITAPYEVEKYISVIHAAEEAGYDVLVIDSATPVWKGSGGLLEKQELEAETCRNKFGSWRNVSKEYRAFIEAIQTCKIHIIVTLRSQTAWDMDGKDENGKKSPVKIGLKPEMRDGFDYEFTVVLNMSATSMGHIALVSKDRTGIFDEKGPFVPDVSAGVALRDWLESGSDAPAVSPVPSFAPPVKPHPTRIYSAVEFKVILQKYIDNGWDTTAIKAAKLDDGTYDREAIDADHKIWNQMTNSLKEMQSESNPSNPVKSAPKPKTKQKAEKSEEPAPEAQTTTPHPQKEQVSTKESAHESQSETVPEQTPVPTPTAPETPAQPAETPAERCPSDVYTCEICGVAITKVQRDVSKLFMGRPLCKACMERR